MSFLRINKCEKAIALLISLAYLPLIIFDMPFRDDLSRAYWGFVGLSDLGRPLADYIYSFIGLGFEGVNLSPLPKIMSVILLSLTSIMIFRFFFHPSEWSGVFISVIAVCNPFMLQNLAYQYDCLPMAISVFICTLAVTNYNYMKLRDVFLCALLIFSGLCLYQSSIVVACVLCACIIVKMIITGAPKKDILKRSAVLITSACISVFAYYVIVARSSDAVSSRGELANISQLKGNLYFLRDRVSELYSDYIYILLSLAVVVVLITIFILAYRGRYFSSLSYSICLPVVFILSFMPSLVLAEGFAGPRVLMAIALTPIYISLLRSSRAVVITASILASILYFNTIIVSYAFSGDMKAQYKRYSTISNLIIQSSQSEHSGPSDKIYIHCRSSLSQEEIIYKRFNPFMSWINPEEPWALRFYIRNQGEKKVVSDWSDCGSLPKEGFKYENNFFKLYRLGNESHYVLK